VTFTARGLGLALVVSIAAHAHAHGQDDATEAVARAESAEDHADPRAALSAWHEVVTRWPTSRLASRARTRIAWIEARSEGDYEPLAAMMAFVDSAPSERTTASVEGFARTVDAMPAGRVRAESRVAIAGDWQRLGETQRALDAWQAALDDPDLDPGVRNLIHESMARTRADAGDLDGALDTLDAEGLARSDLARLTARRLRIATGLPIAWSVLALYGLLLAFVIARGRAHLARALTPLRVAIALTIGVGPYLVVRWWGDDSLSAFAAFAPVSVIVVVAGFAAGAATELPRLRAAVAIASLAAALAGAYASVALYGDALPFA
jgi:hypothetical protein